MYCLTLRDNVYVANNISTLLLPIDIAHLESFKRIVEVLFKWKDFLGEMGILGGEPMLGPTAFRCC